MKRNALRAREVIEAIIIGMRRAGWVFVIDAWQRSAAADTPAADADGDTVVKANAIAGTRAVVITGISLRMQAPPLGRNGRHRGPVDTIMPLPQLVSLASE